MILTNKMERKRVIFLEVTTDLGLINRRVNFYGSLIRLEPYGKYELTKTLSEKEAAAHWPPALFASKIRLERLAALIYKEVYPGALMLLRGYQSGSSPMKVLDAPPDIRQEGNRIYRDFIKLIEGKNRNQASLIITRWRSFMMLSLERLITEEARP